MYVYVSMVHADEIVTPCGGGQIMVCLALDVKARLNTLRKCKHCSLALKRKAFKHCMLRTRCWQ